MTRVSRAERILLGLGLMIVQTVVGCVTASDLEKVDKGLTQRLEAMNNAVQVQVDELHTDVKAVQADTKAALEKITESEATMSEILREMHEQITKSTRDLGKMAGVSTELKVELRRVQQALRQTLAGVYHAEEAALRERLKVIGDVRKELEALEPASHLEQAPGE